MTMPRFYFTKMTLTGKGLPAAEVSFKEGLNVIAGPSDTGKTFIVQCLDYMLGGSTPPEEIPEAKAYELLQLSIRQPESAHDFVLERALKGGKFRLRIPGQTDRILGDKHQPDSAETVSHFLLNLCGLSGKKVRTDEVGKTRQLSFRDIAKLVLVDEESIITERSPVLTGLPTSRTAEKSVFRLLLTGNDDAAIIAGEDRKTAKGRREGRVEVLESLVASTRAQISQMNLNGEFAEIREQLTRTETAYAAASVELTAEQSAISTLEDSRKVEWSRLRETESRAGVLNELQRRFELLQAQYSSDLKRLDSISEAGKRLGQMKQERCPICGALAEHHDSKHSNAQPDPADVAEACRAETKKIRSLLEDLKATMTSNASELVRLSGIIEEKKGALNAIRLEISNRLQPRLNAALQKLKECQGQRDILRRAVDLIGRVTELELLLHQAANPPKAPKKDAFVNTPGANEIENLCKSVEEILRAWKFPNLDRVTFSDEKYDLIVSGQHRASHGKGVRAIMHAAFTIALMNYCRKAKLPHPGLVIIDSPLVVYREPDTDGGNLSRELKDAFYRTLTTDFKDAQVVIMENDDPPTDLETEANVIKFTGADICRAGFIPKRSGPEDIGPI